MNFNDASYFHGAKNTTRNISDLEGDELSGLNAVRKEASLYLIEWTPEMVAEAALQEDVAKAVAAVPAVLPHCRAGAGVLIKKLIYNPFKLRLYANPTYADTPPTPPPPAAPSASVHNAAKKTPLTHRYSAWA